jgi:gluconokinase
MGAGQAIIGIDIGTTSTKSVAFRRDGSMLGSYSVEYPLLQDQPTWAEQEPEVIVQAVIRSVKGVLDRTGLKGEDVAAVGMSSAMHSLIAVDAGGRQLTRSITWADGRSESQARRIREQLNGKEIYSRTGTSIHPMSPFPKLVWLRENRPDIHISAAKFVSIKEYVLYQLFGEWVVDHSIASATGLLRLDTLNWDEEALRIAGIGAERLSELKPGTYVLQGLGIRYAEQMGLAADTPFFLGGSDGAMANLGVGAIGPGEMAVTIGTSAAVRMMTNKPLTDEKQRTFCYHVAETSYIIGGATNNGGIVLQWLRDSLFAGRKVVMDDGGNGSGGLAAGKIKDTYEELLELASYVSPGAGGLLFLPFLTGERAPIYNSEARGTYFGMHLGHRQEHFLRAGLEGVMLAVLSVAEALKDLAGQAREVRASGGFAKSRLWLQMLADMLGQEVSVPRVTEASALGAAVIAMQGLGEMADWSHLKEWAPIAERIEPNLRNTDIYRELFGIYERLCGQLPEHFAAVSDFQKKYGGGLSGIG